MKKIDQFSKEPYLLDDESFVQLVVANYEREQAPIDEVQAQRVWSKLNDSNARDIKKSSRKLAKRGHKWLSIWPILAAASLALFVIWRQPDHRDTFKNQLTENKPEIAMRWQQGQREDNILIVNTNDAGYIALLAVDEKKQVSVIEHLIRMDKDKEKSLSVSSITSNTENICALFSHDPKQLNMLIQLTQTGEIQLSPESCLSKNKK